MYAHLTPEKKFSWLHFASNQSPSLGFFFKKFLKFLFKLIYTLDAKMLLIS